MKIEKIITFLVLLVFVYGIYSLDASNLWSVQINWFSHLSFIIFAVYLVYSLKKAARQQDQENAKKGE
ncbi:MULTISPECIES: hypothetical protein [Myroides]|uniref:Uncharacterized protein n=1 Tax=Myroides albus TaxID=2562892 RepID=A0A6I3LLN7_9FLAO|nr:MULTISPECIES: hypothetical protein [Myroides]MTG97451.1 hypothetical protein [Myroides albus]MVX36130.1 hypothetical protein [Myroides sp. LoEW2-1]UVD79482.1 hypothetical protein NWE55_15370 [Myroides albus]